MQLDELYVTPNYSLTTEVYIRVAKAILTTYNSLDILSIPQRNNTAVVSAKLHSQVRN